jgi:succinate dehydrogenase/fumarate reductase flavoprotein subunit
MPVQARNIVVGQGAAGLAAALAAAEAAREPGLFIRILVASQA